MTPEEAMSKEETLIALRKDVMKLPTTTIRKEGTEHEGGFEMSLVDQRSVLGLFTKYYRS